MFGLQLGRLGIAGSLFNESALWPQGASSPGLWIDPSYVASCFQDSAGTMPLSTVGTVLDSSNPVGLMLDRKGGATSPAGAGIHLSQSTSAARPVASARINEFLVATQDLMNAYWNAQIGATKVSATMFSPNGQYGSIAGILSSKTPGATYAFSVDVWAVSGNTTLWIQQEGATITQTPITVTSTPQRFSYSGVVDASGFLVFRVQDRNASGYGVIGMTNMQANAGSTATTYQPVVSNSSYTAAGFPIYAKFDGTDDAWASATFAAGTLTSSMDCLIAVRRDSALSALLGPYNGSPNWFGLVFIASSAPCFANVGAPTVWVDGTQLSGGTAVSRDTLHTAVTAGAWHIMEFRGLDLSAWTGIAHGGYGSSVNFLGCLGEIQLFASGQDANRDRARARMAAYFGVTLA